MRIEKFWAFVAESPDSDGRVSEGLCAFHSGDGWMPMIASDERRLEELRPIARETARESGLRIKLVEFDRVREEPFAGYDA